MRIHLAVALTLVVAACSRSATEPDPLEFRATTIGSGTVDPTLTTTVTLTNTGEEGIEKGIGGGCPLTVQAYGNPDYSGKPVWDQGAWRRDNNVECSYNLDRITLSPGESKEYHTTVAARDILGDTLRSGMYFFVATVNLDEGAVRVPADHLFLLVTPA